MNRTGRGDARRWAQSIAFSSASTLTTCAPRSASCTAVSPIPPYRSHTTAPRTSPSCSTAQWRVTVPISGFTGSNAVAGKPVAGPATTRAAPSTGCHQKITRSGSGKAAASAVASRAAQGSPADSAITCRRPSRSSRSVRRASFAGKRSRRGLSSRHSVMSRKSAMWQSINGNTVPGRSYGWNPTALPRPRPPFTASDTFAR